MKEMGQVISRNLTARLTKATQHHENKMMRELLDESLQKKNRGQKYTDPNATVWGFKRGESGGAIQKEYEQELFLKKNDPGMSHTTTNQSPSIEMPPDLVDFLKAVGPIQRKVDKDMTSTKVYDSLKTLNDNQQQEGKTTTKSRRRRIMPLQEEEQTTTDDLERDVKEGIAITRSTHFSTQSHDAPEDELRLTDTDIYKLLLDYSKYSSTDETIMLQPQERIDNFSSMQIQQYFPSNTFLSSNNNAERRRLMEKNQDLIQNTLRFTSIPILVSDHKEDTATWMGMDCQTLKDTRTPFLKDIPPTQAQFLLEWEIIASRSK